MTALQVIPAICYLADQVTRDELAHRRIHHEAAYVSALLTRIRDFCCSVGITSLVRSEELADPQSKKLGCDAVLVFKLGEAAKIAFFEAKWPRLSQRPEYRWDYRPGTSHGSHFTDQIMRQEHWASSAYIWEQFLMEQPVGEVYEQEFDPRGCTCVWHTVAWAYVESRVPAFRWTNDDLKAVVAAQRLYWGRSFGAMVRWVLSPGSNNSQKSIGIDGRGLAKLRSTDNQEIDVPCSFISASAEVLHEFLSKWHLGHYLLIDSDKPLSEAPSDSGLGFDRTDILRQIFQSRDLSSAGLLLCIRQQIAAVAAARKRQAELEQKHPLNPAPHRPADEQLW